MWLYWWLRGQVHEGRRRAETLLAHDLPAPLAARAHLTGATMAYAGGDGAAAAAYWAKALELAERLDDAEVHAKATAGVGLAALSQGDLVVAGAHFTDGIRRGEEAGDAGLWLRALAHVWLGTVHLLQDEIEAAEAEVRRGLAIARQRGDRLLTYVALFNLSQVALAAADLTTARASLEEGILLSQETADRSNLAYFLETLAVVDEADGHRHRVPLLLGAAAAIRESVGARVYAYYLPDEDRRRVAEERSRDHITAAAYDAASRVGRGLTVDEAVQLALGLSDVPARAAAD
jgi:tetratricopeptide (TPR) repeat protein